MELYPDKPESSNDELPVSDEAVDIDLDSLFEERDPNDELIAAQRKMFDIAEELFKSDQEVEKMKLADAMLKSANDVVDKFIFTVNSRVMQPTGDFDGLVSDISELMVKTEAAYYVNIDCIAPNSRVSQARRYDKDALCDHIARIFRDSPNNGAALEKIEKAFAKGLTYDLSYCFTIAWENS